MNQRALRKHLKSTQRALRIREKETNHDFIIPSEPKILRLVLLMLGSMLVNRARFNK